MYYLSLHVLLWPLLVRGEGVLIHTHIDPFNSAITPDYTPREGNGSGTGYAYGATYAYPYGDGWDHGDQQGNGGSTGQ